MDLVRRFDIFFIELDPTIGSEINKTRPCVIISPDEMNNALNTVIVTPLTSTIRNYPMRINCIVQGKQGQIALDQLRTIDKSRLKNRIENLNQETQNKLINTIIAMFS